jgi:tetratricopeptide (TPR) repeat protein
VPDPSVKRGAKGSRGTTIVVVGAKPGVAFAPSPWERSAEALAFWPTEEWDKAIEVFEEHLSEMPDHAGTHYNLGCAHARAGHRKQALASLERAIELDGRFRGFAQTDEDFASIREDPAFPAPPAE